jgi:hypothetical protein
MIAMFKGSHILAGIGAVAAIFGAVSILSLKRFTAELETVVKAVIHKVSFNGLDLKIDVMVKNPTGGSLKIKQPFVKLIYGTKTIAASQIKDVNILIPKYGEIKLEPIKINIGFLYLATVVPGLLKEYRTTGKLDIEVKTITTINDSLPYSKSDSISIGGGSPA